MNIKKLESYSRTLRNLLLIQITIKKLELIAKKNRSLN